MAEKYPKRPNFFALRFVRTMVKMCVANELGSNVFTLLTVIAHTEDAKGYRDAVTFFNEQLMAVTGFGDVKTFARCRSRAIESGWLNYVPGGKSKAGKYWVSVPVQFEGLDDAPTDEGNEELSPSKDPHKSQGNDQSKAREMTNQKPGKSQGNDQSKAREMTNHSYLLPEPIPIPVSKIANPSGFAPTEPTLFGEEPKEEIAKPPPNQKPKERPRDLLFDAIAEVTATDPKASGSHIAKVAASLRKADPPYAPEEVRKFAEIAPSELTWLEGRRVTLGEVEKYIGRVRNPTKAIATGGRPAPPRYETQEQRMLRQINEALTQTNENDTPEALT